MNKLLLIVLPVLLLCIQGHGQTSLDLQTIIEKAKTNSSEAAEAKTRYENSRWTYKAYKADLKPNLFLNSTLPNYNSSITAYDQDDGSQRFISRSLATSLANVSLSQNIGLTGGRVNLSTGLSRIDIFGNNENTSYLTTPIRIGFTQDLLGFNNFKWLKKTETIKYEKAERSYQEALEQISVKAVNLYFDYYDAQIAIEIAQVNLKNNEELYKISKGRYQLGKIAEHELLQMELNVLNAQKDLRQAKIDLSNSLALINNYTGMKISKGLVLSPPTMTDTFSVNVERALTYAKNHRADVLERQRLEIESQKNMAQAKSEARPNISLQASYGVSGSDNSLNDAYGNTLPQKQFVAGLSMPITTWGKGRARLKIAESTNDLTQIQLKNQELAFEQEIRNLVNQFNFRKKEYEIAAKSDEIGQKQYEIARKRYLIGKIAITDLNIALQGKDQSRRTHYRAMRNYWVDYYKLRQLTLYDFEHDEVLIDLE